MCALEIELGESRVHLDGIFPAENPKGRKQNHQLRSPGSLSITGRNRDDRNSTGFQSMAAFFPLDTVEAPSQRW